MAWALSTVFCSSAPGMRMVKGASLLWKTEVRSLTAVAVLCLTSSWVPAVTLTVMVTVAEPWPPMVPRSQV